MAKADFSSGTELSFSSSSFDSVVYSRVASSASLVEIHLVQSDYKVDVPKVLMSQAEEESLASSFSGSPGRLSFNEDEDWLFGEYDWSADIKQGRKKVLKLKCRYLVVYSGLKGCSEEYVGLYFGKVARFATYPYFRAQFSLQSSNSGLALPPLPSLTDRVD